MSRPVQGALLEKKCSHFEENRTFLRGLEVGTMKAPGLCATILDRQIWHMKYVLTVTAVVGLAAHQDGLGTGGRPPTPPSS